jgi:hypothetical protein
MHLNDLFLTAAVGVQVVHYRERLPIQVVRIFIRSWNNNIDIKFSADDALPVRSKSKDWKAKSFKVLRAIRSKDLHGIAKIG